MKLKLRHKSREVTLRILYEIDITGMEPQDAINAYWLNLDLETGGDEYARGLVMGVYNNISAIDDEIKKTKTKWRLDRMAPIDRCLLRLGTYHLIYDKDIDHGIIINEIVELAKKYGDINSKAFVNGILDEIAKQVRKNG